MDERRVAVVRCWQLKQEALDSPLYHNLFFLYAISKVATQ